jgi:ABC-type antimicrobial peptide transport system permease subunit
MDKQTFKDAGLTALWLLGALILLPLLIVIVIVAILLIIAFLPVILVVSGFLSRHLFIYTIRSLWTRRRTTILTIGGLALVIFVLTAVLMLGQGVHNALVTTGRDQNVIVLRRAASSELVSQIDREGTNLVKTFPEVARSQSGRPMASPETYVIINLNRKESNDMSNVSVRGISQDGMELRSEQVRLVAGRMFTFGANEIVVGWNIAKRFQGCEIGNQIKFGDDTWTIVGVFSANKSGFESEIWGDVDRMMAAFGRPVYSSMTFALTSPDTATYNRVKNQMESDPRTKAFEMKREVQYYSEQSELMANFIRILGIMISSLFGAGAVIGAAITMYASVSNRTSEIGTLRALGFRRLHVLAAFLVESSMLALPAALLGLLFASAMSWIEFSTVNFASFAELAFGFSISFVIVMAAIAFSLALGIIGGLLPAIRAARLKIINALQAA